jgi:hypothetical protein
MKFIISIFLLILCIVVSQTAYYYLQEPTIEGNTTEPPNTPAFIKKYLKKLTSEPIYRSGIYTTVTQANSVTAIEEKEQMKTYLSALKNRIDGATDDKNSLYTLIYFSLSLPTAFQYFFLPDDTIPIPYNKLHAERPDIFPSSKYYTNIQKICILWQQSILLLTPEGGIIQPNTPIFKSIVSSSEDNGYLFELKDIINKLLTDYSIISV